MKLCVDCKFILVPAGGVAGALCSKFREAPNYVDTTGPVYDNANECRILDEKCGPEAKLFKKKDGA